MGEFFDLLNGFRLTYMGAGWWVVIVPTIFLFLDSFLDGYKFLDKILLTTLASLVLYLFPAYLFVILIIIMIGMGLWVGTDTIMDLEYRHLKNDRPVTEIEYGEGGEIYGYKVLVRSNDDYYSSVRLTPWSRGKLLSDRVPTMKNRSGIYAFKTRQQADQYKTHYNEVVAKVELRGRIVETQFGFRAQHAEVKESYR